MDHAPSRPLAAPAWALLALYVVYASAGEWTRDGPRIWAPIHVSLPDVAQNVLLFVPFGILGVLTRRPRRHSLPASLIEVSTIAGLFSLLVETLQFQTVDRTASTTDVLAAVTGAAIGGLMAGPAARTADRAIAAVRPTGLLEAPAAPVLAVLLLAIAAAAWFPFDPTLDISTMAGRLRVIRRDPWQFDGSSMAVHALLYASLVLAIAVCARKLRTTSAISASVSAAVAIAVAIDTGQLAMGSQPIGLAGLASQVAGALCGGAAVAILRGPR